MSGKRYRAARGTRPARRAVVPRAHGADAGITTELWLRCRPSPFSLNGPRVSVQRQASCGDERRDCADPSRICWAMGFPPLPSHARIEGAPTQISSSTQASFDLSKQVAKVAALSASQPMPLPSASYSRRLAASQTPVCPGTHAPLPPPHSSLASIQVLDRPVGVGGWGLEGRRGAKPIANSAS